MNLPSMALILATTGGTVIFAAFILAAIFRHLTPQVLEADYRTCVGGWYESYLNGCEAGLSRIPQQPVNTYTNLAYLAAGVFVFFSLGTPLSFAFLVTMTYLCVGSSLYHGTSTHWGGMLDVTGIYVVFSGLALYALMALLGANEIAQIIVVFVGAGCAAYFLSKHFRRDMHLKIGIFLGITYALIAVRMWIAGNWTGWLLPVLSFVLFALAFLIWNLDRAKLFPLKRWGHGLWHILTGAASGLLFYAVALGP